MNDETLAENIAAICYGIAGLTNKAGLTFYEQRSDALEGESGMLRYLIGAAEQFTASETAIGQSFEWDWYLAVDAFVAGLVEASDLPSDADLVTLADRCITEAAQ